MLYRSRYNTLIVDLVRNIAGDVFAFERFVATSAGTGVVGVPVHEGKFLLLRQFRHATRNYQYAFPRGYGEDGMTVSEDLAKELEEELGAKPSLVSLLGHVVANSGISGDEVAVFRCEVGSYAAHLGHEEITEVIELSADELRRWIAEGRIDDGFTLAACALMEAKAE